MSALLPETDRLAERFIIKQAKPLRMQMFPHGWAA